jgi:hypothetical protein
MPVVYEVKAPKSENAKLGKCIYCRRNITSHQIYIYINSKKQAHYGCYQEAMNADNKD